ncbi:MAG TPA: response regulator transcription factor [Microthrixaceae bacterium]|nr:response regulator transcription factor [Microthrixaceae bacterium]
MQPDPDRILVVDDDPNVAEVLTRYLQLAGYRVEAVGDGAFALDRAIADPPMLVILDLMLPGMDGLEVCRRLRAAAPTPVIMLTAKGGESDRVIGLELGADDYVAKPFSAKELTARVKAVLRRAAGPLAGAVPGTPVELSDGDLVVDVPGRQVSRDGASIALTAREFELLVFLMRHPGRAFRREDLLQHVWGYSFGDSSTVTVHVRRLREKIEDDASRPDRITTVWGVGYRWVGSSMTDLDRATA